MQKLLISLILLCCLGFWGYIHEIIAKINIIYIKRLYLFSSRSFSISGFVLVFSPF